jgi:MscS family membrane protein
LPFAILTAFFFLLRAQAAQVPTTKPPPPVASAAPAAEDQLGRGTPRGCVAGFLKAAGRDDYARAAQYLDTGATPVEAQELARQLKVVLDLGLSVDVDKLPRTPEGDLQDGFPPTRQKVGFVKTKTASLDVVLDRVQRGTESPLWLFSAVTLQGVPNAFGEL